MLQTAASKIFVFIIAVLVISIPAGSYLLSKRFHAQKQETSKNEESNVETKDKPKEVPKETPKSSLDTLKEELGEQKSGKSSASAAPEISFGPTLNFKIIIEGRPAGKQGTKKLFLGLAQGQPSTKPQYLLTFSLDVPDNGEYKALSIAGLTQGDTYTAYLKGASQIATASAFVVKPTASDLGILNLITGDVNEDNTINTSDYNIVKNALGATPTSEKWNPSLDFNLDNWVNSFDLSIVSKNLGKTGLSGVWVSPPPPASSGTLTMPNIGTPETASEQIPITIPSEKGFWIFIPR